MKKKWQSAGCITILIFLAAGCSPEEKPPQGQIPEENNVADEAAEAESSAGKTDGEAEAQNELDDGDRNGAAVVQAPAYEIDSSHSVVPLAGTDAPKNVVLLTIDDAFLSPGNDNALEMAHILHELNAGAIFFINGQRLTSEEDREKLREIHELGFEIGNHTMNHFNLAELSAEEQREQIVELNELIEEITGKRPRFLRAPFGSNTEVSKQVAEEEGMQWMNWTYGYDWVAEYMEAGALAEIMVESPYLRDGANLLMHDREFTKDALQAIVTGLREKGYEIVAPELIR
ncbi:Peptidoglycan/xylan/chitin deacetylase, PgdA/CDA1 family [Evansella caseinilytica]|uniref:Peptidoglycan/xylan/chitin deacetylase, PgdA/CDA1 family n=1 Tax=Evansella caseinilytica TaxID=1503961 RepID=A0A1H3MNG4_9BACI|nr:polysaccharide deacetylase family protein [Evansella caseinilytica]SDY78187.1 Peptidoglycan/xylan/chitin deacetylase, PgdA/CDA1 family [Evansella caseinilytica]